MFNQITVFFRLRLVSLRFEHKRHARLRLLFLLLALLLFLLVFLPLLPFCALERPALASSLSKSPEESQGADGFCLQRRLSYVSILELG